MRYFVTGASGWIGSAAIAELLGAGHQVDGLARSDEAAAAVAATGADVRRGSLDDLDVLRSAAEESDGVVHMAFRHDVAFTGGFVEAAESDRRAIEVFGEVLAGSDAPLVIASGTAGLPVGVVGTERDFATPDQGFGARVANERIALDLASSGVRSMSVRFAPTVHGDGDHGFVSALVGIARERGVAGYVDDGSNRWPAVHRSDAGRLVAAAVEKAPAGSVLHAIAEEGVPLKLVAEAIGTHLDLPVVSVPAAEAADHFGFLGGLLATDHPASSAITRELLGWQPTGPGLVEDLEQGHYFR